MSTIDNFYIALGQVQSAAAAVTSTVSYPDSNQFTVRSQLGMPGYASTASMIYKWIGWIYRDTSQNGGITVGSPSYYTHGFSTVISGRKRINYSSTMSVSDMASLFSGCDFYQISYGANYIDIRTYRASLESGVNKTYFPITNLENRLFNFNEPKEYYFNREPGHETAHGSDPTSPAYDHSLTEPGRIFFISQEPRNLPSWGTFENISDYFIAAAQSAVLYATAPSKSSNKNKVDVSQTPKVYTQDLDKILGSIFNSIKNDIINIVNNLITTLNSTNHMPVVDDTIPIQYITEVGGGTTSAELAMQNPYFAINYGQGLSNGNSISTLVYPYLNSIGEPRAKLYEGGSINPNYNSNVAAQFNEIKGYLGVKFFVGGASDLDNIPFLGILKNSGAILSSPLYGGDDGSKFTAALQNAVLTVYEIAHQLKQTGGGLINSTPANWGNIVAKNFNDTVQQLSGLNTGVAPTSLWGREFFVQAKSGAGANYKIKHSWSASDGSYTITKVSN